LPLDFSSALFVAGPTAVGKSAMALALAERLAGEIISVDSMQVYRGLDLGTAKPSGEDRRRVPHHLIDVVELTESFDAARYVALARAALSQILARGRLPIFCGGTGLYFQAVLAGLGASPAANPALRAALEAQPLDGLLAELAQSDPVGFAGIDRKNKRRVVRALEVLRLTGQPFSAQRASWATKPSAFNPAAAPRFYVLNRAPDDLRARIEARVDDMFAKGLVVETERLLTRGLALNPTAMQAIGYRQVVEHLRGERSLTDTVALVKQRTRQFAKRQLTWFRHQAVAHWLQVGASDSAETVADRLLTLVRPPPCAADQPAQPTDRA
jgi:tRNA dimethylallyltransferase